MADTAQGKKYTISQAAKVAGVSRRTIQRWISAKKLTSSVDSYGTHLISVEALASLTPLVAPKNATPSTDSVSPARHRYAQALAGGDYHRSTD